MNKNKNQVLISGAVVFKERKGKVKWFLIRQSEDDGWEIPKVVVRKNESSVRASLRMMGEQAGMRVRVLEEAARAGGVTTTGGHTIPQRYLYYLVYHKVDSGEIIGFDSYLWLDYLQAVKKISSKREKKVLKQAKEELKKWKKKRQERRASA